MTLGGVHVTFTLEPLQWTSELTRLQESGFGHLVTTQALW